MTTIIHHSILTRPKPLLLKIFKPSMITRTITTTPKPIPRSETEEITSLKLRKLMRNVPHPVTIITTADREHRSTISSLTSIALRPYPLVSFSIQLPSRLASQLISSKRFEVDLLDDSELSISRARSCSSPLKRDDDVDRSSTIGRLGCQVFKIIDLEGSLLIIGRVLEVDDHDPEQKDRRPLVYYRQNYTTVK